MKHFYTKALLIIVGLLAFSNITKADYTTISFLKKEPIESISCENTEAYELIKQENSNPDINNNFVTNITCDNIELKQPGTHVRAGLWFVTNRDPYKVSSIVLNLNPRFAMKVFRVMLIGYPQGIPTDHRISLFCNGNDILMNTYNNETINAKKSFAEIQTEVFKSNPSLSYILNSGTIDSDDALTQLKIELKPTVYENCEYQLLAIRLYYNEVVDLSEVETAVEDLEAEQGIKVYEYYDLMGRRLPEAPKSGVFVRKCGGKVEKLIANER